MGYEKLAEAVVKLVIDDYLKDKIKDRTMERFFKKSIWLGFFDIDAETCIRALKERKNAEKKDKDSESE